MLAQSERAAQIVRTPARFDRVNTVTAPGNARIFR